MRIVAYRPEVLTEILKLKGLTKASGNPGESDKLDKARAARLVEIPQDQFGRYLEDRVPKDEAITKIANGLELSADFLLEIGKRFEGMTMRQALAHMALDRYIEANAQTDDEADILRYLADHHADPPMWSKVWEQNHTSLTLTRRRQLGGDGSAQRRPRQFQNRRPRGRETPVP